MWYWLIGMAWTVLCAVNLWGLKQRLCREEETRALAKRSNLTLQYAICLHKCGVDSQEAHDMKLAHSDDETFIRRAQIWDDLFRMKKRIWEGK